jgi:hypothetical protein
MDTTGIFPIENDISTINKKVQQLRQYDEVIVRNLQYLLPLQMDILVELRNRRRSSMDAVAQSVSLIFHFPLVNVLNLDYHIGGQTAGRQGPRASKVCNQRQVLHVSRRTHIPESIGGRSHELDSRKASRLPVKLCVRMCMTDLYF